MFYVHIDLYTYRKTFVTPTQVFCCKICETYKGEVFYRTCLVAASEVSLIKNISKNYIEQIAFCNFRRQNKYP